jgi:DNA mismatch repair protein MutS
MENITPMLRQYQELKSRYADCILFFRLGDFYEMFYDDAKVASGILDVVLTSRDAGKGGRIPMCGIPYHAKDSYLAKLIKAGFKVAICEQVEDPALAKGLVKRDVIRVITSGTFIDEASSDSRYLMSLSFNDGGIGVSFTDAFSGQIQTNAYADKAKVIESIAKLPLYECLFPAGDEEKAKEIFGHPLLKNRGISLSSFEDWAFNPDIAQKSLLEHFNIPSLSGFGIAEMPLAISSAGALLEYLKQMNHQAMRHIDKITFYSDSDYTYISPAACHGLELDELFTTIDHTLTPLGKRTLREWMYHPLKTKESIACRQEAVQLLKNNGSLQQELSLLLRNIPDIEKNLSRISCGYGQAKDLLALRNTLLRIPQIQKTLLPLSAKNTLFNLEDPNEIRILLEKAINPDIPLSNPEGKTIRSGYHKELDELREIQENGREWLKDLQAKEIKRTGISSLKIGFNQVFGYYLEVTNSNLNAVPPDYIRKQTLANAERFITPELKSFEEKMLTAEEKVLRIEKELLNTLFQEILNRSAQLHLTTKGIAVIDALHSLCTLALSPGYILPEISEETEIAITDGRHPVIEKALSSPFIPNDTLLDCKDNHLMIITGPNMSGKSTYIRQVAVLVILAQMGSFIPAQRARIGIVDKIFTRIGAHDEISKGQSTFMVEMSETAGILNNLSNRSLIILDEIGRGTSTYDGLSLAWAIAEYLDKNKVRTLFATHFHELTALAEDSPGVRNYNVAVKEWNDEVVFLHKIIPGGTDESYGIYVAKIASIPKEVIDRSRQILLRLELNGKLHDKIRAQSREEEQLMLFQRQEDITLQEIKRDLQKMDTDALTPLTALNKIHEWKKKLEEKE